MLPDREGRFKATIGEHGVNETGPNDLATFICEFHLTQELANGDWIPVDEDFSITGYFYLEKRDGSLNTITIDNLKEAFGWDGRDPFWLQDTDFAGMGLVVQVKLEFEEYQGKERIKVRYVNSEDWSGGGVRQADDSTRRSISDRLGSKFRANAGGSPAPAPAPKPSNNGRPAPPPSKPTTPGAATMQQAWEAFVQACPDNWSREDIENEWFSVLDQIVPGKQPDELTPAEWGRVLSELPDQVVPF